MPARLLWDHFQFLSTPSARRATAKTVSNLTQQAISIHALREEGDIRPEIPCRRNLQNFYPRPPRGGRPSCAASASGATAISIHALREEGDEDSKLACTELTVFLSTPSARRATHAGAFTAVSVRDFYPRPPRGGRLLLVDEEGRLKEFLSTPSARRATCTRPLVRFSDGISIHALREEGDLPSPCIR